jgi:AraC-like DNA-binding protein
MHDLLEHALLMTNNIGSEVPSFLSTDAVPTRDRAEFWRHLISKTFVELDCDWISERPVQGEIMSHSCDDIRFTRVRSREHVVKRTPKMIDRSKDAVMLLSYVLKGRNFIEQDGRITTIYPGEYALYDSTRPYKLVLDRDFDELVIHFPKQLLTREIGRTEPITGRPLGRGSVLTSLLANHLRVAASSVPKLSGSARALIGQATVSMIAAVAAESEGLRIPQSWSRTATLYRIKAYASERLNDAELTGEKVAAALGISVRYLQLLFQEENGSFSDWLWEQRMKFCRRRIEAAGSTSEAIAQIALDAGFSNFSHFSRRFREAFGISAREMRALGKVAESQ